MTLLEPSDAPSIKPAQAARFRVEERRLGANVSPDFPLEVPDPPSSFGGKRGYIYSAKARKADVAIYASTAENNQTWADPVFLVVPDSYPTHLEPCDITMFHVDWLLAGDVAALGFEPTAHTLAQRAENYSNWTRSASDHFGKRSAPPQPKPAMLPVLGAENAVSFQSFAGREDAEPTVLADILRLSDGWDGEGSVAPSAAAKATIIEVCSRLARYLSLAEIEVDGSTGEISLSWYFDGHSSVVSLTVLPAGRVVAVSAQVGAGSKRTVLGSDELDRLNRVVLDAGLHRING